MFDDGQFGAGMKLFISAFGLQSFEIKEEGITKIRRKATTKKTTIKKLT